MFRQLISWLTVVWDPGSLALLSIAIFAIGVSVLAIVLFKNRKLQRKLVYLIIVLAVVMSVTSYFLLKMDMGDSILTAGVHMQPECFFLSGHFIFSPGRLLYWQGRKAGEIHGPAQVKSILVGVRFTQ
jgi:hypothetical protein